MSLVRSLFIATPIAAATLLVPVRASADVGRTASSAVAKGTIGGALLGAELVLAVEAAASVKSPWAYLGGGLAGAVGGGIGGYFVEQNASPRVSMLMLAGGLTLAIPTTVLVLSATAYEPPSDYLQDAPPADEPVAESAAARCGTRCSSRSDDYAGASFLTRTYLGHPAPPSHTAPYG